MASPALAEFRLLAPKPEKCKSFHHWAGCRRLPLTVMAKTGFSARPLLTYQPNLGGALVKKSIYAVYLALRFSREVMSLVWLINTDVF